jgi:hypothetical protein
MKVYILFGQRKCSYDGEFAPEALDIINEFGMDENPEYLENKKEEYILSKEFVALSIIPIEISDRDIDARLGLNQPALTGIVK